MKRLASLALFGLSGLATGIAVAAILLAFVPRCGYDCENYSFGVAVLSIIGCTVAFQLIGYVFTRGARLSLLRTLAISGLFASVAIVAAGGHYVFELRELYARAEAARPVVADFDFMYMAITTRRVRTYTKAEGGAVKPASTIPQWQRCVIDGAGCDRQPRQAHMRCKGGVVYVDESDWKAFSLIPQENLKGAIGMKSMDLCAPGNDPEPEP
ncbi:hypothetical protein [Paraburkholderia sp. 2C]|jgi:hypothetical protein